MVALDRFGSHCPRGATGRATVSYTGGCSFESSRGRCRPECDDADLMHWRVDREERCSLAKRWPRATSPAFDPLPLRLGRYASLAGGTLFRKQIHGSAVGVRHLYLPLWRSGATEARRAFTSEDVGSKPTCVSAPPSDRGSPPSSQPGSRGSVPRGGTGANPMVCPLQCGVAQRKSGWPLTTVVGGSMPSSAATAPWPRIQVPDCNPGHASETPAGASIAVVAQWKSVSLPTRRPRGQDPPTALRGQGVDRYTRGFHPRVMGAVPIDPSICPLGSRPTSRRKVLVLEMRVRHLPPEPPERRCSYEKQPTHTRRPRGWRRRAQRRRDGPYPGADNAGPRTTRAATRAG